VKVATLSAHREIGTDADQDSPLQAATSAPSWQIHCGILTFRVTWKSEPSRLPQAAELRFADRAARSRASPGGPQPRPELAFADTTPRVELELAGQDRGVQLGPLTVVEVVVIDQRDQDLGSFRADRLARRAGPGQPSRVP